MDSRETRRQKRKAGEAAVRFVESGMVIGLGHGSTAVWALRLIGEKLRQGELSGITAVPCSSGVAHEAAGEGIPLTAFGDIPVIDLTIDGADEVDPQFNLIKGAGGALLREKIVAQASLREVIVVDGSKPVRVLGSRSRLPVEIHPFGLAAQLAWLEGLGGTVELRRTGENRPFITDGGNLIADCRFSSLTEPAELAARLDSRAGLLGHGLFLGLVTDLITADAAGVHHHRIDHSQSQAIHRS